MPSNLQDQIWHLRPVQQDPMLRSYGRIIDLVDLKICICLNILCLWINQFKMQILWVPLEMQTVQFFEVSEVSIVLWTNALITYQFLWIRQIVVYYSDFYLLEVLISFKRFNNLGINLHIFIFDHLLNSIIEWFLHPMTLSNLIWKSSDTFNILVNIRFYYHGHDRERNQLLAAQIFIKFT